MDQNKRPAVQGQVANETQTQSNHRTNVLSLQPTNDDDAIDGLVGAKPLLPEGIWLEARYTGHRTALMFKKQPKLFLEFEVVDFGEHHGTTLFRAFRVALVTPRGKFKLHAGGDLYALLVRLLQLKRADRPTLRALRHMLFRVRTRTVTTNRNSEDHPVALRYTVIDQIEPVQEAGSSKLLAVSSEPP